MDYGLFAIILLQFIYIIYKDYSNSRERERLQLKLMSKDVSEYKIATGDDPQDTPAPEPDPYIPAEEASVEDILKAEDKV